MPVFFVQTIRTAEDSSMELFCLFSYKFQGKCSRSLGQAHSQLFPSFPALHIISSFPLFSFKFSFKLLLLFFYLLSDHKTFLPFQGISSWELGQIKLKYRQFPSQSQWLLLQGLLSLLNISDSEKFYLGLCVLFKCILVIFFSLEIFYASNWFVMLQRHDYKPLKTNQWISVIWICEAHQSIHSLWNLHDMHITMLHFISFLPDQYL